MFTTLKKRYLHNPDSLVLFTTRILSMPWSRFTNTIFIFKIIQYTTSLRISAGLLSRTLQTVLSRAERASLLKIIITEKIQNYFVTKIFYSKLILLVLIKLFLYVSRTKKLSFCPYFLIPIFLQPNGVNF